MNFMQNNVSFFLKDLVVPYSYLDNNLDSYVWRDYIDTWLGYRPQYTDASSFEKRQEVLDMPSYPADGSIKIIDGVVVVKF